MTLLGANSCKTLLLTLALLLCWGSQAVAANIKHGIAMFDDLKYQKGFKHFDYVNPQAPKGGTLRLAVVGSFDNLNPFILKGEAASSLQGLLFETLTQSAADEVSSAYGLLAETIEYPDNRAWIIFHLRPEAKWHDGTAVTADDVVFSFNTLKEQGHPFYRSYYRDIKTATKLGTRKVKFTFQDATNRELPVIVGQMPVFSKHYYQTHEFEKTTLKPPLGSGPYRIKQVDAGRSITYERNPDYWGWHLAVNQGRYNFDTIQIDYYRDATVAVEALKAGEYDFRRENISKTWNQAYNIPHLDDGRMIKIELPDGTPSGMQSFIFNIRRAPYNDIAFREALSYVYDFEWANKQLFYSAYARNSSFFGNSEFAAEGLPSKQELALLKPFKKDLPPRLFTDIYQPPTTKGDGYPRANLLKAKKLLEEAGYIIKDKQRINPQTQQPIHIEFLLVSPSFERVVAPFVRNLTKLGIQSSIRIVDSAQYIKRREEFDYDIMVHWFTQGASPGNEQINYWHSSRADVPGSLNLIGIKNPAIDAMVERITKATTKEQLVTATKALDRILTWNFYVIPHWYSRTHRVIYWNKFGRPEKTPPFALGVSDTWWVEPEKEQRLKEVLEQ